METDEAEDVAGPLAGGADRKTAELGGITQEISRRLIRRQTVTLGHPADP